MEKKIILLSIAVFSAAVSIAQNFSAVYDFKDVTSSSGSTDPTPVPAADGVSFGSFSATGTSANSNASGRFSFTAWPAGATTGNDVYASLTGSVNTSEYYEVSIGPESGYTLNITGITFSVQRSGTGIRTYVVRSSLDGFTANLPASVNSANTKLSVANGNIFFWVQDATTSNQNGSTIHLDSLNFKSLTAPVTFRFYGYNSEGAAGTFSIDNVAFTGVATATATSLINHDFKAGVVIYPNPTASGIFKIDPVNVKDEMILTVYNVAGEIILVKNVNTACSIDLSGESNGCYFIVLRNNGSVSRQQIIINR